jgi:FtsP/CotA-like multicopper oxidase with cupredoxin domain
MVDIWLILQGPVIEADEGDTLRINVANNMLVEAAMHWYV